MLSKHFFAFQVVDTVLTLPCFNVELSDAQCIFTLLNCVSRIEYSLYQGMISAFCYFGNVEGI